MSKKTENMDCRIKRSKCREKTSVIRSTKLARRLCFVTEGEDISICEEVRAGRVRGTTGGWIICAERSNRSAEMDGGASGGLGR